MNNLAFVDQIHVQFACQVARGHGGRGGDPIYELGRKVPLRISNLLKIGYHFLPCWLGVFVLRVSQVVIFLFPFCGKK